MNRHSHAQSLLLVDAEPLNKSLKLTPDYSAVLVLEKPFAGARFALLK